MTIQEAIKSGKPFKRHYWSDWRLLRKTPAFVVGNFNYELILEKEPRRSGYNVIMFEDVLANDWEVKDA